MSRVLKNHGKSRRARWLAAALTVTAIALAACGSGDGEDGDAAGTESAAGGEAEPILIKALIGLSTGKILDGSTIGDAPFCPGGTVKDKHGTREIGLVDRTITCSDGTLRMGFDPQHPVGNTQRGPWRIISGTSAYEGWKGSGEMKTTYPNGPPRPGNNAKGRETFTGTVTH